MNSILISIKKLLGLSEEYAPFDTDLIIHINTFLGVLNQLGVGVTNFKITGATETWDDFLSGSDPGLLDECKTYVYIRTKLVFDPPSSSIVTQALKETMNELEWRLNIKTEAAERAAES